MFSKANSIARAATTQRACCATLYQPMRIDRIPNLKPQKKQSDVLFPERRNLRRMPRVPEIVEGVNPPKMTRMLRELHGPELVQNKLFHKQFGVRALQAGRLKSGHYDMIRIGINKKIDESRMFAIWRVDAPWQAMTKKGVSQRMGQGKRSVDHYTFPLRTGRIIVELAGNVEYEEAYPILNVVAHKMPFKAEVISHEELEMEAEYEQWAEESNLNPFTFEYCMKNNMLGCHTWCSPYDKLWFGKYR